MRKIDEVAHTLFGGTAVSTPHGKAGGEPVQEDEAKEASHDGVVVLFFACFCRVVQYGDWS